MDTTDWYAYQLTGRAHRSIETKNFAVSKTLIAGRQGNKRQPQPGFPSFSPSAQCMPSVMLNVSEQFARVKIFGKVSDLPGLEVDLLFFDTTSSSVQTEQADEPATQRQATRCGRCWW